MNEMFSVLFSLSYSSLLSNGFEEGF